MQYTVHSYDLILEKNFRSNNMTQLMLQLLIEQIMSDKEKVIDLCKCDKQLIPV